MALHSIRKGLDLPIKGAPTQTLSDAAAPRSVAVLAADYPGMKPTMHVAVGDSVRRGQVLFDDKKREGVRFTSPAAGRIAAINRGAKRAFQSVVVELDSGERSGQGDHVRFESYSGQHPGALNREQVAELLLESGLWTALRGRPYGRVAEPGQVPRSIFVNAMDSEPLAPSVPAALAGRESDFERGVAAVAKLTDGKVYVCKSATDDLAVPVSDQVRVEEFSGPHPAGATGTHIHTLDPVDRNKLVWYLSAQDAVAIGALFGTGELDVTRVVSLAGPSVANPRLLRTRIGASTDQLVEGELQTLAQEGFFSDGSSVRELDEGPAYRVISGSVLSGRTAMGDVHGYLGRYHQQVSVLPEDTERRFLGWMGPGVDSFSVVNLFLSKLLPGREFPMTTTTYGSERAIVPIGSYEKVMPLDIVPTFLLKALVMGDVEKAEELGCLELEEDDLALCTFVCPGKIDYGPHLRDALTILEKEG